MEMAEDIRHTLGNKQTYKLRNETIKRLLETAKEQHGFRYTQYVRKEQMEMKAGCTFAYMNLKKLAKLLVIRDSKKTVNQGTLLNICEKLYRIKNGAGEKLRHWLYLQSEYFIDLKQFLF